MFTLPVGAVAKYCDEHVYVYVCVCLSARISPVSGITLAIFTKIFAHAAYDRGSVLVRQGDEIPSKGTILGVFFPIDNVLYSIAFGTHTKTAEPIKMPLGI